MAQRIPESGRLGGWLAVAMAALFVGGCTTSVEKLWEFPTSSPLYSTPLVLGDLIVFGSEGGTLHAVDAKGQARWQFQAPSAEIFAHPATDGNMIFFGATNQSFYAIDSRGTLKWTFNAKERIKSDPTVLEGVVYVTSYDGHIYALKTENGKKIWQFPPAEAAPGSVELPLILTVTEANAIFLNEKPIEPKDLDKKLAAEFKGRKDKALSLNLDPKLKHAETVKIMDQAKKAGFEKVALVELKEGATFQAPLVPEPPKQQPEFKPDAFSYAAPAIRDGVLYVGNLDGYLYAVNTADGSLKWRFKAGEGITSTAWVESGVVYFGSKDDSVYAIDAATGAEVRWKFKTGGDVLSSPRIADGLLAVGSDDGNFYVLDAKAGQEKCHLKAAGPVISYGVFYKNLVFFSGGQGDGTVYAMDRNTCQLFWSYKTGYKVESDPVIEGDRLYVTSGDHKLYAFKINKTPEK